MKRTFMILASALLLTVSAGCQVPTPTPGYNVVWTWTAPGTSGTFSCSGSQPCTYIVSAETITGTTCDPTTSSNYKQLNASSPVAALTYTQTNTTGTTVCAVVTTVWQGANSQPSVASAPVTSPAVPLAPSAPSGNSTVAALDKPALPSGVPVPSQQLAMNAPLRITGHIVKIR